VHAKELISAAPYLYCLIILPICPPIRPTDYLTYASLAGLTSFPEYYRKGSGIHLALKCPAIVCCCHPPERLFHAIVCLTNNSLHCQRLIMGVHIAELLSGSLNFSGSEGFLADFLEYGGYRQARIPISGRVFL
jgi:hypothetical protein